MIRVSEDKLKEAADALKKQRYIKTLLGKNPINSEDTANIFVSKIDSLISKIDSILKNR